MSASPAVLRAALLPWLLPPEPAPFVHGRERLFRPTSVNAVGAALYQRNADLLFEIPDLPAERWLRSVQLLLGSNRQTTGIGHGNEVTEMPQFHFNPHIS